MTSVDPKLGVTAGGRELIGQDRNAHVTSLRPLRYAKFENIHDLVHRRTEFQRGFDMTTDTGGIFVSE